MWQHTLTDLENSVPGSEHFVNTLRALGELHNMVKREGLSADHKTTVNTFMLKWDLLHHLYGIHYTLKIHIIKDHLTERLTETGETLHEVNDEHVESAHHFVRKLEEDHQL